MSTQTLSNILRDVDRTIFKKLDNTSTNWGYSVDRSVAGIRTDKTAWEAAEQAIITEKGFVIGIRSFSNSHDIGNKSVPRIVYRPQRTFPGSVGNSYIKTYEDQGLGIFNKQKEALQTSDYFFEIGIHAKNADQFRVLHQIVVASLMHNDHLTVHNVPSENFLVERMGYMDNWDDEKGTIDARLQFKVPDLFESMPIVDDEQIAAINTIDLELDEAPVEIPNNLPVITSSLEISMFEGETLIYELTAIYALAYEWDFSNVPGIALVEYTSREIIGGSLLSAGVYDIPVKAINYIGETSETITLTIATSAAFTNTKSLEFFSQDYLEGSAALVNDCFGRASNGSGSNDAWSVSFFFNPGTSNDGNQTIFYFGGNNDLALDGKIRLMFRGFYDTLRFEFGNDSDYLRWNSQNNLMVDGNWYHIMVTYDGGTTGNNSADITDYHSRFKFFLDGAEVTNNGSWQTYNNGWAGSIDAGNFRIGRFTTAQYMRDGCNVDEFAIWDNNQSLNVSSIYNLGSPFDLSSLSERPKHWWRMGDEDTFPSLTDRGSEANCTLVMNNMSTANIVEDTP
jgi:hypothetical protein